MVQCRTKERNDGTTYKICYDDKKTKTSPTKSSPNISIMNELVKILTDEPPSYLKRHGDMFVITSKGNKYLDQRTPKGNPIKIAERVSYKPRSAPISMLVMPKNGDNLMVKAGKKKGNDFTFALNKLELGLADGTISLTKTKAIPTSEWGKGTARKLSSAPNLARNVKKSQTPPRRRPPPQPKTPRGRPVNNIKRRAKTPPPYRAYTPIREGIPPRNRINLLGGNMIFD